MKYGIRMFAMVALAAASFSVNAWWGPFGAWMQRFFGHAWFGSGFAHQTYVHPRWHAWNAYPPYAYPAWGSAPWAAYPRVVHAYPPAPRLPSYTPPRMDPPAPIQQPAFRQPTFQQPAFQQPQFQQPARQVHSPFDGFDPFSMEPTPSLEVSDEYSRQWLEESTAEYERSRARTRARTEEFQQQARDRQDSLRRWIDAARNESARPGHDWRL